MTTSFDPRIIRVGVEVSGVLRIYENLALTANITKSWNALQNEATVNIIGLAKEVRDHLSTETSPYNANYSPKRLTIEAGRASTGTFTLFSGDIVQTDNTQPPDIVTTIKSKTLQFNKGVIISRSFAETVKLSVIAKKVAEDLGLTLIFEATDRNISNFSFTGASTKLIQKLSECGGINAYADDNKLVVKDVARALANIVHVVSERSGMIGTPELTDLGVRVRYLLDPNSQLGGTLSIDSSLNPALSGDYTIYNLWHVVASRDVPFYTIAECVRPGRLDLSTGLPVLAR